MFRIHNRRKREKILRKKIYSLLFILLFCVCCISLVKRNYGRIKYAADQFLNAGENSQPDDSAGPVDKDSLGKIDESQLSSMDTPTNIKHEMYSGAAEEMQFRVTNSYVSRKLEERFNERVINRADLIWYDYSVMDEDYTLKKDFYYLYATVNFKKISDYGEFSPYILKYTVNDNGTMIYIDSKFQNNFYNGCQFDSCVFAFLETDGKRLILGGRTEGFAKGDDVTYDVCYMITDEMLSKDNVYFAYHSALKKDEALKDKDQKYIKIDLGENYGQDFKE